MMRPRDAAERRADGDLALAAGGAHQQQVGDVGAGDEQHEADGAGEHEQRLADVADQHLADRIDAERLHWARAPFVKFALKSAAEVCSRALACSSETPGFSRPAA